METPRVLASDWETTLSEQAPTSAFNLKDYLRYWGRMIICALTGGRLYYLWLFVLAVFISLGLLAYSHQITEGLSVTNMSDQVSWGIGIANFIFFVGIAASTVLIVVPAYITHNRPIRGVVILAEQLAFAAIVVALLFILTDLGRPERVWHMMVGAGGKLNLPSSLLAWDMVVFNLYLVLNMHIPGYRLYKYYRREKPTWYLYLPLVFVSIASAVGINTVEAFMLSGLGTRHFWNSSILAPRFLMSAFSVGPAVMVLVFSAINGFTAFEVSSTVFKYLRNVMRITLPVNFFLLLCELFKDFYPNTLGAAASRYLYFGTEEHNGLVPFIWTAVALNVVALTIVSIRPLRKNRALFITACVSTIIGIWIEKSAGLVFPGFTPSPLGEIVEYTPNLGEIAVSLGVVALGAMIFTFVAKASIAILTGEMALAGPLPSDDHQHQN